MTVELSRRFCRFRHRVEVDCVGREVGELLGGGMDWRGVCGCGKMAV